MSAVIFGILAAGMWVVRRCDAENAAGLKAGPGVLAAGFLGVWMLWWRFGREEMLLRVLLAMVMGCLLFACVTDRALCQVYNVTWWAASLAAAPLFWQSCRKGPGGGERVLELALFLGLQLLVFARMYGRADCYAFCICALAQAGLGMGLLEFLCQMAAAFGMLALVQGARGNLGGDGNLKQPVPFLPYITASFYLMLALQGLLGNGDGSEIPILIRFP